MAEALAGRTHSLILRDDGTGRGLLGCHQHRDLDRSRGQRVRHQRPEVVDHRSAEPRSNPLHCDGEDRPEADRHRQQSQVLCHAIFRASPCFAAAVFGYDDRSHGGHAEIVFEDVRVPVTNLIGNEGDGFAIAQARLGPGRIHHCMRCDRGGRGGCRIDVSARRMSHGVRRVRADQGVVRDWFAESRVRIEQVRLLVLKTAWLMDTVGNKAAHSEIQAIKIATPATVEWILDKAIQVGGPAVSARTSRSLNLSHTSGPCGLRTVLTRCTRPRWRVASCGVS